MNKTTKLLSATMFIGIAINTSITAQNITGSGTNNNVLKFTSTGSTAGNSSIFDNGSGVGIGTSNPSSLLTIGSTGNIEFTGSQTGVKLSRYNIGAKWALRSNDDGSTGFIEVGDATSWSSIRFLPGASEAMRITSAGYVGIGTTSASSLVTLGAGNVEFTGTQTGVKLSRYNVGAKWGIRSNDNGSTGWIEVGDAASWSSIRFLPGASEAMRITSGGSVGIGTSSPYGNLSIKTANTNSTTIVFSIGNGDANTDQQLVVFADGFVICRDVRVMNGTLAHPDYVFNDDYKLMSLTEVEAFIKRNKHLPNVLSAEEVKKEGGVVLGKIQNQTLQKTEELFLHVIEINKKMDALNKKVEVLTQENDQLKLLLRKNNK